MFRIVFTLSFFLLSVCRPFYVYGADWLTLIGTEPAGSLFRMWGVIQPQFVHNYGESLHDLQGGASARNGRLVVKNTASPWFDEREAFSIKRLRAGCRGRFSGFMKNSFTEKINYFFMIEAGQNLMTYTFLGERSRAVALSDAFFTFNHIPGLHIQTGLFKNPGPEETFQPAGFSGDYIEFTDFTGREYLERFAKGSVRIRAASEGGGMEIIGTPQTRAYGFSAARDWGIQFFNTMKPHAEWDISYALKLGRGESISTFDMQNNVPEIYLYGSAEYYLPGGNGSNVNGIKLYSWFQWGKRNFRTDPEDESHDRFRYGCGMRAKGVLAGFVHRFSFELMFADGMVFLSPSGNVKGGYLQYAVDTGNMTRGITLDYGFYIDRWRLNARWHLHDILYHTDGDVWTEADHRLIYETTFGVAFYFNPKVRIMCDFTMRDVYAHDSDNWNVKQVVDSVGNRIAIQLTWII